MHFLYIIYSPTTEKFYTGETNDFSARLNLHNTHKNIKAFTKVAADWKPKLIFNCKTREEAIYLERFIKRMKSRKFLLKIIEKSQYT